MANSPIIVFASIILAQFPLQAQDLRGAEAILKELAEKSENPGDSQNPGARLRQRIATFPNESASLPPEKAAAEWLSILDRYLNLPSTDRYASATSDRLSIEQVFSILPPTAAWNEIISLIEKRPAGKDKLQAAVLQLLASILGEDPAAPAKALELLRERFKEDAAEGGRFYLPSYVFEEIQSVIPSEKTAPGGSLAELELQLTEMEKRAPENNRGTTIRIPTLPDSPATSALLLRVLKSRASPDFADPATHQLAVNVALGKLDQFSWPLWSLIRKPEHLPLYTALVKKFPVADPQAEWERATADTIYFFDLAATGRHDEALAFLDSPQHRKSIFSNGYFAADSISENHSEATIAFLYAALEKDPNYDFWSMLGQLSGKSGRDDRLLAFLLNKAADPRITVPKIRGEIDDLLFSRLLEADRTDEALDHLGKSLAAAREAADKILPSETSDDEFSENPNSRSGREKISRLIQLLNKTVTVGDLIGREDLVKTGLDGLAAALPRAPGESMSPREAKIFITHNRAGDAEKIAADRLILLGSLPAKSRNFRDLADTLEVLAFIYDKTGRHQDVLRLLEDAPFWQGSDLAQLLEKPIGDTHLALIAARALANSGRGAESAKILRSFISKNPKIDEAYQMLLAAPAPDTMEFLDRISARNRFEERPLIWKAHLQNQLSRFSEAEKTVRSAIAIDPSDGEQGKGDRMRAYSVLADSLAGLGDQEQSGFLRNVVAAIRESETADDWWNAGMPRKAVKIYEQALAKFADAYCIQSRLALRYAAIGETEKAAEHYRRAFELMPDSFGRIESHCFGCEGAFTGIAAQKIADRIFTELAGKPDAKAQVFYLLGYLRNSQERPAEAAEFFRKAVALDPDYINAWKKLVELSGAIKMPPAEKDEIAFTLLKLTSDPSVLNSAANLRRVWDTLLALEKSQPPAPPETLLALPSTARFLKSNPEIASIYGSGPEPSPRSTFSSHVLVSATGNILDALITE